MAQGEMPWCRVKRLGTRAVKPDGLQHRFVRVIRSNIACACVARLARSWSDSRKEIKSRVSLLVRQVMWLVACVGECMREWVSGECGHQLGVCPCLFKACNHVYICDK